MRRTVSFVCSVILALATTAPVQAQTDPDPDMVVVTVTVAVQTAITDMVAAAQESQTSLWQVPYSTIAGIDAIVDEGLAAVDALTVPECLEDWRDTVRVGLILLNEWVEVVGRAAGQPDDTDLELVSAYAEGYTLLVTIAPYVRATADCTLGDSEA